MNFNRIGISDLNESPVRMFSEGWALLTAGDAKNFNSMTVSWGTLGELWGKDVAMVFVRPQRYTYEFMEKYDTFTLSFFDKNQHAQMGAFGSLSGRDTDKYAASGFSPLHYNNTTYVDNSRVVLICRKIAFQDLKPSGFLDDDIQTGCYENMDYHRMYVGEIIDVLLADCTIQNDENSKKL